MEIRQMENFITVCEELHFTRANLRNLAYLNLR